MMKEALIIFAKNPEGGKVKTRLAATIGDQAALEVYQRLLFHTALITANLPFDKFVFYSDTIISNDNWDDLQFKKRTQSGQGLGERMNNAFASIFNKGYSKIVIIGTDCPGLDPTILLNSFTALDLNDIVIGPAEDGGYYLVGMKLHRAELFENIRWSSNVVLAETLRKCDDLQLTHFLLPVLSDIDEEKDLIHLKHLSD